MFQPRIVFRDGERHRAYWHLFERWEHREIQRIHLPFLIVTEERYSSDRINAYVDRCRLIATRIPHNGSCLYVLTRTKPGDKELTVYDPPCGGSKKCPPSPSSDAQYRLRFSIPYCGIYGQELSRPETRAYAQTSSHYHNIQHEYWMVTQGRGKLFTRPACGAAPWQVRPLRPGNIVDVLPGTAHQIRTDDTLVTTLVMLGHPEGICQDDHHYVEPPPGIALSA